jgi:hypothetical protein
MASVFGRLLLTLYKTSAFTKKSIHNVLFRVKRLFVTVPEVSEIVIFRYFEFGLSLGTVMTVEGGRGRGLKSGVPKRSVCETLTTVSKRNVFGIVHYAEKSSSSNYANSSALETGGLLLHPRKSRKRYRGYDFVTLLVVDCAIA